ncbi:hypothetical protein [Leifsonia sp. NPDC058248]|uniref:hypothetical protein n=1 Tax=Leifsonia sp. NPDC058248 TaxID=3346402 RepID=UPI0036DB8DAC
MSAGTFEIVIKGTLGPSLVAALDGFAVRKIENGMTHLVGRVPDQPRLYGLIQRLSELTVELVSVNPTTSDYSNQPPDGGIRREAPA